MQVQPAGQRGCILLGVTQLRGLARVTNPALVKPGEQITAQIAHVLAVLDKRRATATAAAGGKSSFRETGDQRRLGLADSGIEPSGMLFGKIIKRRDIVAKHVCYSYALLALVRIAQTFNATEAKLIRVKISVAKVETPNSCQYDNY
jgi:hypothetical protein